MEELIFQLTELNGGFAILVVFGILLLCGLGLPIPEDIPLIAAGYLIYLHETTWAIALLAGMSGVLVGDSIIFWFGKRLGAKLFRSRLVMFLTTPQRILKIKAYYRKYGEKIIIAGRFLPGLRAAIFFVAGSSGVRYSKFIALDGIAALVSVPVWLFLGSRFGSEIDSLMDKIHRGKTIALAVLGGIVLVYIISFIWKAKTTAKRVEAAATIERDADL
ncbi:MAG: DedA family protein [Myxococcota bacterium]|nr:DedA family protein [Myxococcota bacterium]